MWWGKKCIWKARGCRKQKNILEVEFFYMDTPGWTTYLCNQALHASIYENMMTSAV